MPVVNELTFGGQKIQGLQKCLKNVQNLLTEGRKAVITGLAIVDRLQKSGKSSRRNHHFRDLFVGHIFKKHRHSLAAVLILEMLDVNAVMRPKIVPFN